ncbi:uncharacterized protein ColSpa_11150 [Colletotrichum spaethianum]|uniref:Uncharacterized protein n=1 Tax=Colletotrichum spaethianum TaxID=700344 RepID=A0AA37UK98_9PEZI|nr:uncharacterized protein ColSpa_11150 [Colletotrichum spaethianum]GKT50969.1 hypothetical protein ColSpa_11150 [Colletotrichum spaethianum]
MKTPTTRRRSWSSQDSKKSKPNENWSNNRSLESVEDDSPKQSPPPKNKTIVHPAPSHDGSTAFVVYEATETVANDDEAGLTTTRPPYAFVIYDTTPEALRPGRTAELVQEIFERTYEERRGNDLLPNRIEVVAVPMPQPSPSDIWDSEKQWKFRMNPKPIESRGDGGRFDCVFPWFINRVRACVLHYEAELKSRLAIKDKVVAKSWYLPERINDGAYARGIFLITQLKEDVDDGGYGKLQSWKDALGWTKRVPSEDWNFMTDERADRSIYGGLLQVLFQPREERWEYVAGVP